MRVDLPLDKKTGKSGLGHRAAGPPGRRAAGPSWAVGRGPMGLRALGPLGRRGPWAAGRWAAGLLLAKPLTFSFSRKTSEEKFKLDSGIIDDGVLVHCMSPASVSVFDIQHFLACSKVNSDR